MTLREALQLTAKALADAGIEEAESQARLLVWHAAGVTPSEYLLHREDALLPEQQTQWEAMLQRRCAGEPLQHILGVWEFAGLPFQVDSRALIPRMETEMLVEETLRRAAPGAPVRIADVGTGTGCIGLSVAAFRPEAEVALMDLSPDALALAQENSRRLGLQPAFYLHDMREPLPGGPYDILVSNPPYIPTDQLAGLQREVQYDPRMALDGGPDGLWAYRALAERMEDSLSADGALLVEIGHGQARDVQALLEPHGRRTGLCYDLEGHERVVWCEK